MRKLSVIVALVAFCLVVGHAVRQKMAADKKGKGGRRGPSSVPVVVLHPRIGAIEETLRVTGEVLPSRKVEVSSRVAGFLRSVNVRIGDAVSAGRTVLATLDEIDFVYEVERAEAEIGVVQATVKEKRVALAEAERILEKEKVLFAKHVGSQETLDVSRARLASAKAALELALAQVERSRASLAVAKLQLERVRVLAPIDGMVAERHLDGGAQVASSTTLVTVVDVDRVLVSAEVTESDYGRLLPHVQEGGRLLARVSVAASETAIEGRVRAVAPAFDSETRTARVEIEVANAERRLLPGMFARVEIVLREVQDTCLVPVGALVERSGERGVYVVTDEVARFRAQRIGIEGDGWVQVLDRLEPATLLVGTGNHLVSDGSRVVATDPDGRPGATTKSDGGRAAAPKSDGRRGAATEGGAR